MITTKFTCGLICFVFFQPLLIVSYLIIIIIIIFILNIKKCNYDVTEIIIFKACFYST